MVLAQNSRNHPTADGDELRRLAAGLCSTNSVLMPACDPGQPLPEVAKLERIRAIAVAL